MSFSNSADRAFLDEVDDMNHTEETEGTEKPSPFLRSLRFLRVILSFWRPNAGWQGADEENVVNGDRDRRGSGAGVGVLLPEARPVTGNGGDRCNPPLSSRWP